MMWLYVYLRVSETSLPCETHERSSKIESPNNFDAAKSSHTRCKEKQGRLMALILRANRGRENVSLLVNEVLALVDAHDTGAGLIPESARRWQVRIMAAFAGRLPRSIL